MVSSCGSAVFSELVLYSILQYVVIQIPWLMLIYKNLCKYLRTQSNNVQVKQYVSDIGMTYARKLLSLIVDILPKT